MKSPLAMLLNHKGGEVHSVTPDTTVLEAVQRMNELRVGALLVIASDKVEGIFTERDILSRVVAVGMDPGSVAVSTPGWCICTQDCQDISGWPFVAPTSICFQLVSTREVSFTWGDLVNGLIGMAFDSAAALICRGITGPGGPPPETFRAALRAAIPGALTNAFIDHVTSLLPPDAQGPMKIVFAAAFAIGLGKGGSDVLAAAVGPAASYDASVTGGAAQSGIDGNRQGTDNVGHDGIPVFD